MGRVIHFLRHRLKGQQVAAAFQVFDELYVPTRYEAMREHDRQTQAPGAGAGAGRQEPLIAG